MCAISRNRIGSGLKIVGLKQVSELRKRPDMPNVPTMRFYSGDHGGKFTHHDVALVENPNLPPPKEWALFGPVAINHIAIAMPTAPRSSENWKSCSPRG